ncbi:hypothetical protein BD289DRAFT_290387 [Coniella lustricola]|uniref:Uncharacterized protein n=1 Tax=Coniella lustricola TaxID=2025994 RepID=A0A2T3A5D6_9PEZI|nr:hypothetical protein BD289DRAFT_290387 [Coniella lustricola]
MRWPFAFLGCVHWLRLIFRKYIILLYSAILASGQFPGSFSTFCWTVSCTEEVQLLGQDSTQYGGEVENCGSFMDVDVDVGLDRDLCVSCFFLWFFLFTFLYGAGGPRFIV